MDEEDPELVQLEDFGGDGIDYSAYFHTDQSFETHLLAFTWAQDIAKGLGFLLDISGHKKNRNGPLRVYFKCKRGLPYRGKVQDLDECARSDTRTQYCRCKFTMKTQMAVGTGFWNVIPIEGALGMHNHGLIIYPEGYRELSGLDDEAKLYISTLVEDGVEPKNILKALRRQFPHLNTTIRHVYNYTQWLKRESRGGMTMVQKFVYDATEAGYIQHIEKEEDTNLLTHAFMAHPTCVQLFRTYHWIIGIDSTYKTNRYKMPLVEIIGVTPTNLNFLIAYALIRDETEESYMWVLGKLRNLLGSQLHPTVIVTDRELGLFKPIEEFFPTSSHLLCTWHINQCVENYVGKLYGNKKEMGAAFKNGKWHVLIHSTTVEKYEEAFERMAEVWNEAVIKYVVETWLPYKEMFVRAWTNKVLHFGTRTTNRVESAHSCLKGWLESSTLALDSIWKRIDMMIQGQLISIRNSLERCRRGDGRLHFGPLYDHVRFKVSPNCLGEISLEKKRMEKLGDDVANACGCVIRETHGLPCACEIKNTLDSGRSIYLKQVHVFWQRLTIGSQIGNDGSNYEVFEDLDNFRRLSQEVEASDPAIVRSVNLLVSRKLHPDIDDIKEPRVKEKAKGRPRKGMTSTKRNPSGFESGRKTSNKGARGKSGDSDTTAPLCLHMTSAEFPYEEHLPDKILRYRIAYLDVQADGNCGFRCVASAFHGSEHMWSLVRHIIVGEILGHALYSRIYGGDDQLQIAVDRIRWSSGECGPEHWMTTCADLFPIATAYNCAVVYFTLTSYGNPSMCSTVLPLRSDYQKPCGEIVIAHLGPHLHYIRLYMKPNFPIPPIHPQWHMEHTESVDRWDNMYATRIAKWKKLYPSQMGEALPSPIVLIV